MVAIFQNGKRSSQAGSCAPKSFVATDDYGATVQAFAVDTVEPSGGQPGKQAIIIAGIYLVLQDVSIVLTDIQKIDLTIEISALHCDRYLLRIRIEHIAGQIHDGHFKIALG